MVESCKIEYPIECGLSIGNIVDGQMQVTRWMVGCMLPDHNLLAFFHSTREFKIR